MAIIIIIIIIIKWPAVIALRDPPRILRVCSRQPMHRQMTQSSCGFKDAIIHIGYHETIQLKAAVANIATTPRTTISPATGPMTRASTDGRPAPSRAFYRDFKHSEMPSAAALPFSYEYPTLININLRTLDSFSLFYREFF